MAGESEKVSIVLPTFNGEKYLRQSIESCLQQTYRDIELVIVDDASTDSTADIVRSYSDRRIVAVRNHENTGLPASLNTGFAAATGTYLTWTSDDNYYFSTAIETMVSCLRREKAHFVYADYVEKNESAGSPPRLIQFNYPPLRGPGNDIGACFLYTREVMREIGTYDTACRLAEDYDYWLRVLKKFTPVHVPEPLYLYRYHSACLSVVHAGSSEIKAITVIVRLKNGYVTIAQACDEFFDHVLEKKLYLQKITLNFLSKKILKKRIFAVLKNFQNTTIEATKQSLMKLSGT